MKLEQFLYLRSIFSGLINRNSKPFSLCSRSGQAALVLGGRRCLKTPRNATEGLKASEGLMQRRTGRSRGH